MSAARWAGGTPEQEQGVDTMQTGIAAELSLKAISTENEIAVSIHEVGGKMGNDIQIMSRENFEKWRQNHIDNGAAIETAGGNTVIIRHDLDAFAVYPTEQEQGVGTNTRYTVETVEEWRPRGQFTKITFHVIDTEDNDREVAVFTDGMHRDAQDMADDLNNGGPEPTDRAYAEQWRDYR